MNPKKMTKVIAFNSAIALINIGLFSDALLGLSLFEGSAVALGAAWAAVAASGFAFVKGNTALLKSKETHLLVKDIHSLESCISVFEEALKNGDVFDKNILINIEQIKRFQRKKATIEEILLQKFSKEEMSYQKFKNVLSEVENVIYLNMRSILNKISAFDVYEYEAMQRGEILRNDLYDEKLEIYNGYIEFVNNSTKTNEDILLKLDKILLEISKYNTFDGIDIHTLPAIVEMDELIKNAKLYK